MLFSYIRPCTVIFLLCILHLLTALNAKGPSANMICRRPDISAPISNISTGRKFVIYDTDEKTLGGLGNFMVFYPVVFSFAALTGRDIIISDHSVTGSMCRIFECGFPLLSQARLSHPNLATIKTQPVKKGVNELVRHVAGDITLSDLVINPSGFIPYTHGRMIALPGGHQCISAMSSCPLEDWLCYDIYFFSELFKGPFFPNIAEKLRRMVVGTSDKFLHRMLYSPFKLLPHIDIGFHIRLQLPQLEAGLPKTIFIFNESTQSLLVHQYARAVQSYLQDPSSLWLRRHDHSRKIPRIFVSCDDAVEKVAFVRQFLNISASMNISVEVVYMNNDRQVVHMKHLGSAQRDPLTMLDSVFDWFALAMCNTLFAYRQDGNIKTDVSTFVLSAAYSLERSILEDNLFPKLNRFNSNNKLFVRAFLNQHANASKVLALRPQYRHDHGGGRYNYSVADLKKVMPASNLTSNAADIGPRLDKQLQRPLLCRKPNVNAPIHPDASKRKFAVYDSEAKTLGGLGNTMGFFPTVYFYSILSGRDIIIPDHSIIGSMCQMYKCGFPLLSNVSGQHSVLLQHVNNFRKLGVNDMSRHFSGEIDVSDEVVSPMGYLPFVFGKMLHFIPGGNKCISEITGCPTADVLCQVLFAMQELFNGPFVPKFAYQVKKSLVFSMESESFVDSLIKLPLSSIPRFDVGFHIRMQSQHFESGGNSTLDLSSISFIANNFSAALRSYIEDKSSPWVYRTDLSRKVPRIFVSCDDTDIKFALIQKLRDMSSLSIDIVYIKNEQALVHTKFLNGKDRTSKYMVDTVADWLLLGMCNTLFSYRRDTNLASTFALSAGRLTDRDVIANVDLFPKFNIFIKGKGTFNLHYIETHPVVSYNHSKPL